MAYSVVPSVNVFILRSNQVMLARRANTGWMDGYLCPTGGHVEKGETPHQAIIREIQEELGVAVDSKDVEFACVAARNTSPNEYVGYEFVIRDKDYTFINAEPEKCSELVWVEVGDLPNDIVDQFKQILEEGIIGQKPYLEVGF